MRVILDECLPRSLGAELSGHQVMTVPQAGWAGVKNGRLLELIAGQFDAFVTVDRNLPAQQNTSALGFGVVVIRAPSNKFDDLKSLVPALLVAPPNPPSGAGRLRTAAANLRIEDQVLVRFFCLPRRRVVTLRTG